MVYSMTSESNNVCCSKFRAVLVTNQMGYLGVCWSVKGILFWFTESLDLCWSALELRLHKLPSRTCPQTLNQTFFLWRNVPPGEWLISFWLRTREVWKRFDDDGWCSPSKASVSPSLGQCILSVLTSFQKLPYRNEECRQTCPHALKSILWIETSLEFGVNRNKDMSKTYISRRDAQISV